jgi:hypothetical protein
MSRDNRRSTPVSSKGTGFPRVLNAIFVAKRVFEKRNASPLTDEAA